MIIAVMLSDIVQAHPGRPRGWMVELLSSASDVTDQHAAFPIAVYVALWEKYNPTTPLAPAVAKLWDRRPWWDRLHALVSPTPEEFDELRSNLDDNRRAQLDEYLTDHPVRWDDFPAWASEFHDWINVVKLGRTPHRPASIDSAR